MCRWPQKSSALTFGKADTLNCLTPRKTEIFIFLWLMLDSYSLGLKVFHDCLTSDLFPLLWSLSFHRKRHQIELLEIKWQKHVNLKLPCNYFNIKVVFGWNLYFYVYIPLINRVEMQYSYLRTKLLWFLGILKQGLMTCNELATHDCSECNTWCCSTTLPIRTFLLLTQHIVCIIFYVIRQYFNIAFSNPFISFSRQHISDFELSRKRLSRLPPYGKEGCIIW
jgi:hypothetical protein